jgi:hypothetical protein
MSSSSRIRERSRSRDITMRNRRANTADRATQTSDVQRADGRRCNSQGIFLREDLSSDVYSWEYGQPFHGAYKSRQEMDRQQHLTAYHRRRLQQMRTPPEGLGALRNRGPYHNSGPALGDLHRALRRGAAPDQQET